MGTATIFHGHKENRFFFASRLYTLRKLFLKMDRADRKGPRVKHFARLVSLPPVPGYSTRRRLVRASFNECSSERIKQGPSEKYRFLRRPPQETRVPIHDVTSVELIFRIHARVRLFPCIDDSPLVRGYRTSGTNSPSPFPRRHQLRVVNYRWIRSRTRRRPAPTHLLLAIVAKPVSERRTPERGEQLPRCQFLVTQLQKPGVYAQNFCNRLHNLRRSSGTDSNRPRESVPNDEEEFLLSTGQRVNRESIKRSLDRGTQSIRAIADRQKLF